jgi:tetratricopeptide (TPR) repeat protein
MAQVQYSYDVDWVGTEFHVKKALELGPDDPNVLRWVAILADLFGTPAQSVEFMQKAVARDPLDAEMHGFLAWYDYRAGRFSEAQEDLRKALDLNPGQPNLHLIGGFVLLAKGEPAAALIEIERDDGDEINMIMGHALAYYDLGQSADANAALANFEKKYPDIGPTFIAAIHAYRGEIDQAFSWLDRAYRNHANTMLGSVRTDPMFKNLRSDPRFNEFLGKLKLPPPP